MTGIFTRKAKFLLFVSAFLIVFSIKANAGVSDPSTETETPIPLDGGISLLVAAGIGYGAKKIVDKRSRKSFK